MGWGGRVFGGETCDRLTLLVLVQKHAAGITSKNRRLSARVAVLTSCFALAFATDIPSPTTAIAVATSSVAPSHRRHAHTNTGKKQ
jgi:hypothetical protein